MSAARKKKKSIIPRGIRRPASDRAHFQLYTSVFIPGVDQSYDEAVCIIGRDYYEHGRIFVSKQNVRKLGSWLNKVADWLEANEVSADQSPRQRLEEIRALCEMVTPDKGMIHVRDVKFLLDRITVLEAVADRCRDFEREYGKDAWPDADLRAHWLPIANALQALGPPAPESRENE